MIAGSTVRLTIQWVDWNGNPVTPTAQTLTIINSHGTTLATIPGGSLTNTGTGAYYYDYPTPTLTAPDTLCAQWSATLQSENDVRRFYFTVTP